MNSKEHLSLTNGAVALARKCAVGSSSRDGWMIEARRHYTQYNNERRIERR